MAKDADAGAEDAAGTNDNGEQEGSEGAESDEFDKDRALATIQKQRESEKAAKAKAKALEEELAKYREADAAKEEAEKTLETKVAERDEALKAKDVEIADLQVKHSFELEAISKGVADPALAYLAAKEQGLLGTYDPKEGKVSGHDWDALAEKYPSFASDDQQPASNSSGDAGRRGKKGKTKDAGTQFNEAIRGAARARRGIPG